jgi:hypothetical protein
MTVKEMKPVRFASPAFLFLTHKRDYGKINRLRLN